MGVQFEHRQCVRRPPRRLHQPEQGEKQDGKQASHHGHPFDYGAGGSIMFTGEQAREAARFPEYQRPTPR